jgi:hypothetical protein
MKKGKIPQAPGGYLRIMTRSPQAKRYYSRAG